MTNYNDGNWHGWNGGECPVHPETVVEIQMENLRGEAQSGKLEWMHVGHSGDIIAFRVVKGHKEPREFWAHKINWVGKGVYSWEWAQCDPDHAGAVLFREVVE